MGPKTDITVAFVALSVRGAMGQYISALARPLAEAIDLHVFVPAHFAGKVGNAKVHFFKTGTSHTKALVRFLNPLTARSIWLTIKNFKPDVIHLFNGEGYPWALLWAHWAWKDSVPLLVTVHDPEPHPGNFWEALNARLRRYTLLRAKSVHVHAQCFTETMKKLGVKDMVVIPHGSFAPQFLQHKREGVNREPLALFFGRIERYKGLDILVKAGLLLNGRIKIAIAGPGKIPSKILRKIEDHPGIFELHNRYLSDKEVAILFQRASVCVLPYHQATQSSVPLIAAAFGVPVVATAVGAFPEDIKRVNGIIVPPGNPELLAQAIEKGINLKPVYPAELEFDNIAKQFYSWYKGVVSFCDVHKDL